MLAYVASATCISADESVNASNVTRLRVGVRAEVFAVRDPDWFWSIDVGIGVTRENSEIQVPDRTPWCIRPIHQNDESLKALAAGSQTRPIYGLSLKDSSVTDAGLARLKQIRGLKYLRLVQCGEITNAGLAEIRQIPELNVVELYYCKHLTDEGLALLAGHKQLSSVLLGGTEKNITASGLRALSNLPELRSLFLVHLDAANADGLAALAEIKSLRSLTLFGCPKFNGMGLAELAKTQLRVLQLWGATLDRNGLRGISQLPDLEYVDLSSTDLREVDTSPLGALRKTKFLKLTSTNANDRTLEHLKSLSGLQNLLAYACDDISDDGLAHIQGLTKLGKLQLSGKLTEAGVTHLTNLQVIRDLTLPNDAVTDKSLEQISKLKGIETLRLGSHVTDKGLALLANCPSLHSLDISHAKISDEGLAKLSNLPKLQDLVLWNTEAEGRGFIQFRKLPNFQILKLHHGKIRGGLSNLTHLKILRIDVDDTDAALRGVYRLSSLDELDLSGSNVTDEGLGGIAMMTNLRQLDLESCDKLGPLACQAISQMQGLVELALAWNDSMSDSELARLKNLERLETLKLTGPLIIKERRLGSGLVYLKDLKRLSKLDLFNAPLSPESYPALMQLENVAVIDLRRFGGYRESWETDEKRKELELSLPNTKIYW